MSDKKLNQHFSVPFAYDVLFTTDIFNPNNPLFAKTLDTASNSHPPKVLIILDKGMYRLHPDLFKKIQIYTSHYKNRFHLLPTPVVLPGGEVAKNDSGYVSQILAEINKHELDRHSYVVVIGGGAVIDTAGYAASVAHRGIRLVRIPTTVLAQNDAAIGVKNGINAYGKKNFLGTFTPPHAVINDSDFLKTLDDRDWKSGIAEAVKVALIKDADFFKFLEQHADLLKNRNMKSMQKLIYRCAELHLNHIARSGDPFETGSSRPLDFGHWAAHKLEQLTHYSLRHGEAVAIGLAVDSTYSYLCEKLSENELYKILELLKTSGFELCIPELEHKLNHPNNKDSILYGLQEFREHLGGELTIMLLERIGKGIEVHEVDHEIYRTAIGKLKAFDEQLVG